MIEDHNINDRRLVRALAEQLKLPLLQIAKQTELGIISDASFRQIRQTAETAIQVIDGLLLSTDLHAQQTLKLEPVSIASVLFASSEDLRHHARLYNCELEINIDGRFGPVMGNFEALRSAFTTLGYSVIEEQPNSRTEKKVVLSAHKSKEEVIVGVYGSQPTISKDMLKRAKALFGTAKQPLQNISSTAAAGVFIADSLLGTVAKPLKISKHKNLSGLSTSIVLSKQLQLIAS